jgi:uncharacterized membrane protein
MAAFCSNCGAQVPGSFCPNCGTAITAGAANPTASAAYAPPPQVIATSGGLESHVASALCYTPFVIGLICSILFLVIAPYNQNKLVRFSAFQSLFLHLGLFVLGIALGIVSVILTAISHVLALVLIPVYPLVWLGILILLLFLMYKSFNNQKVKLPVIGDLAEKQA